MKIAIVILNWNGKALLERFLPSVVKYSDRADIYVADNASTDDSISFLTKEYPNVKLIQNSENGGYAKGYNDALTEVNADIFCLLNSDVEVTEGWLDPIIHEFQTNSDTTIIQPKILDEKHKSHFEYAGAGGGFIDKYGFPYCRGRVFDHIEEDKGQYNDSVSIFWASGACLFIRSDAFKFLNGFDESYFAHFEEIDLCWRAYNYGFKTKYVGASTVYHVGGATLNSGNPKKTYLNFRNSLYTLTKNLPSPILGTIFMRMVLDGIAGLKFLVTFKGLHFIAILKAHFSFYSRLGALLKVRNTIPQRKNYFNERSIVWSYFVRKRYRQ